MKENITSKITSIAVSVALVTLCTIVITIPIAGSDGYINFGDIIIFICGYILGPIPALIAGGVGSALADVLTPYAYFAPFTLVIKGLEGFVCGLIIKKFKNKSPKISLVISVGAMIVSGLIMVSGYFIVAWILQGTFAAALLSLPSNLIQMVVSVGVACGIIFTLKLSYYLKKSNSNIK